MKFILLAILCATTVFAHEKNFRTQADKFATGVFKSQKLHPWPFPLLSIGHAMHSYQDYGGSPYWHDGLDIRSAVDQPIYASAGGKIVNIENYVRGNPYYWEVAILDDDGFVWKYHHVAKETIPQEIQAALKSGRKIPQGTLLGNVIRWNVSAYGEVYHHCHMLVVAKDGKYTNPFLFLEPLPDTVAPVINTIGIALNHRPTTLKEVKGPHALFVQASDLTLHQKFILPPYKISYKLDGAESKLVWEFINLPSGTSDTDYINDFYMNGTCGDYSCRKFYLNLNFTQSAPRGTMNLEPGSHSIEVTVEDFAGNKTSGNFQWRVL